MLAAKVAASDAVPDCTRLPGPCLAGSSHDHRAHRREARKYRVFWGVEIARVIRGKHRHGGGWWGIIDVRPREPRLWGSGACSHQYRGVPGATKSSGGSRAASRRGGWGLGRGSPGPVRGRTSHKLMRETNARQPRGAGCLACTNPSITGPNALTTPGAARPLGQVGGIGGDGTRRLEDLQRGVEGLGAGDLRSRVAVSGRDEIADLARRFNVAADRIEALVDDQRRMLASASHELRSPLARVRMALELVADDAPERREVVLAACRDVEELDALVGDLLLASRLEARAPAQEAVDLTALAAEEGARAGAVVHAGEPAVRRRGRPRARAGPPDRRAPRRRCALRGRRTRGDPLHGRAAGRGGRARGARLSRGAACCRAGARGSARGGCADSPVRRPSPLRYHRR